MPIPAKLSRKIHETFGDEAAEAMVDWMEQADARRAELRELNELSTARFESRLREGITTLRMETQADIAELRQEMHTEFADVRQEMHAGFARCDTQMAELRGALGEFRQEMRANLAEFDAKVAHRFAALMKWSFVFWVGSAVTLVAAQAALAKFWR